MFNLDSDESEIVSTSSYSRKDNFWAPHIVDEYNGFGLYTKPDKLLINWNFPFVYIIYFLAFSWIIYLWQIGKVGNHFLSIEKREKNVIILWQKQFPFAKFTCLCCLGVTVGCDEIIWEEALCK